MYSTLLAKQGALAAALISMAAPVAHAGWEDAPSIDLTLDSQEPLELGLVEFRSGGEIGFGDGLLGIVRQSKDASTPASFTQLKPALPCEEKDSTEGHPVAVTLQPDEQINIRMRNPHKIPKLDAILHFGNRTNPKLLRIRLRMDHTDSLQVNEVSTTTPWFPFKFALGPGRLKVKQDPPLPGAAEKAKEEAELAYWKEFLVESNTKSWAR